MFVERPLFLLLLPLAALPIIMARRRPVARHAVPVAAPDDALVGAPSWRVRLLGLLGPLVAASAALAIIGAAGLAIGARAVEDRREARDIVIALDASESMRAVDFALDGAPASRMDAALAFAGDFIAARRGDRIGLIAFGSRAVTQCPLTFDHRIAAALLAYVKPEALGKRTALGDAIALAVARLADGGALVLVSDGESTAGRSSPSEAAGLAAEHHVVSYPIGIGSAGPAPVPSRLPSGRVRMEMKDYALDEAALRRVADLTGGRYFHAADSDALRQVFAEIDGLEEHARAPDRTVAVGGAGSASAACAAALLAAVLIGSSVLARTAPRLR